MNNVQILNHTAFGKIRTIEENGKMLFCGSDVAKVLGYRKPQNAIAMHCKSPLKQVVPHPQSSTKTMEMLFIPEGDIYRLITHSTLPSAAQFEHWIFGYASTAEELLNDPAFAIRLFAILKAERSKSSEKRHATLAMKRAAATLQI